MSANKETFLGKKRDIDDKLKEKDPSKKKEDSEEEEIDVGEESESDDNKEPKKSLFGPNEQGFSSKGLFGDLDNPKEPPKSLFGDSCFKQKSLFLFENKPSSPEKKDSKENSDNKKIENSGNLFGNINKGSLFGNINKGSLFGNTGPSTLFGNKNSSLFNNDSSLFSFSEINKKKEDEEEEGGDDNIGKSNSPVKYNPEKDIGINEKDDDGKKYKKIFVKKMDNFYLYSKTEKKFISKGEGYLSIETKKENDKPYAVLMYRNHFGGILCEGILYDKITKFNSNEIKFKHIAHVTFITIDDKSNPSVCSAKIPFIKEEDIDNFKDKLSEAIVFLGGKLLETTTKENNLTKKEEKKEENKK